MYFKVKVQKVEPREELVVNPNGANIVTMESLPMFEGAEHVIDEVRMASLITAYLASGSETQLKLVGGSTTLVIEPW